MREYLITKVEVIDERNLRIVFEGGESRVFDLTRLLKIGGVFARLADRSYLERVKIMCGGNFLEWPGELDIGADSLWHRSKPEPSGDLEPNAIHARKNSRPHAATHDSKESRAAQRNSEQSRANNQQVGAKSIVKGR